MLQLGLLPCIYRNVLFHSGAPNGGFPQNTGRCCERVFLLAANDKLLVLLGRFSL